MSNWAWDGHRLGWPKLIFSLDIAAGSLPSQTFSTWKIENIFIKFKSAKIRLVQVAILVSQYNFILAIKSLADILGICGSMSYSSLGTTG